MLTVSTRADEALDDCADVLRLDLPPGPERFELWRSRLIAEALDEAWRKIAESGELDWTTYVDESG